MRFTTGQRPEAPSAHPVASEITPAATNQRSFSEAVRGPHLTREQAEDHRAERRDETQRRVAASVEYERLFFREEIAEPRLDGRREVAVLLPVRGESAQAVFMHPLRAHADAPVIEIRRRHRVERKRGPVTGEDDGERDPLLARRPEAEEKKEAVPEADLGQRIFKSPDRLRPVLGAQCDAEQHQHERAPERMRDHGSEALTAGGAARDREGKRCPDQERKGRLDQVV
jgi:hypothetical protein